MPQKKRRLTLQALNKKVNDLAKETVDRRYIDHVFPSSGTLDKIGYPGGGAQTDLKIEPAAPLVLGDGEVGMYENDSIRSKTISWDFYISVQGGTPINLFYPVRMMIYVADFNAAAPHPVPLQYLDATSVVSPYSRSDAHSFYVLYDKTIDLEHFDHQLGANQSAGKPHHHFKGKLIIPKRLSEMVHAAGHWAKNKVQVALMSTKTTTAETPVVTLGYIRFTYTTA